MTSLNDYLMQTQSFLRDQRQDLFRPQDLIRYINRSRREVAMRTQCIRVLTPISGQIISATVVAAGTGYTSSPTITLSDPDFPSGTGPYPNGNQATALGIVQNGSLTAVDIQYGGEGYFQPTASITDSTGTGASVTLEMSPLNLLNQGQEVYPFSGIDLTASPGCQSVFAVQGISVIYANYRYSLPVYSFSIYQAQIRQYPFQYQYVPTMASQYGQGTGGSFYVFPLPSQSFQYECDCYCTPQDLVTNLSVEAIPEPWTDAIPYFAAHLAFLEIQNANFGKMYFELYDKMVQRYSNYARPGRVTNPYGRF